jgi:HAD superfamily hydrolase (TIGR01509 family)
MVSLPFVFLDIGATLIQGPQKAPARFLAERLGLNEVDRKELNHLLLTEVIETPDELASLLVAKYGVDAAAARANAAAVWETQMNDPAPVTGAYSVLSSLRNAGIPYGFISNIWPPYAASFRRLFGDLAKNTTAVFSYREGVAKPDPAIYRVALDRANKPASDCIMIGDSYDNDVVPAISLGLRTIWIVARPDKEKCFLNAVETRAMPAPDLRLHSIADLGVNTILTIAKANRTPRTP